MAGLAVWKQIPTLRSRRPLPTARLPCIFFGRHRRPGHVDGGTFSLRCGALVEANKSAKLHEQTGRWGGALAILPGQSGARARGHRKGSWRRLDVASSRLPRLMRRGVRRARFASPVRVYIQPLPCVRMGDATAEWEG